MDIRFQNLGPGTMERGRSAGPRLPDETLLEQIPELDKVAPWLVIAYPARLKEGKTGELAFCTGIPTLPFQVLAVGLGPRKRSPPPTSARPLPPQCNCAASRATRP